MIVINKIKISYKINCNLFDNFEDFPRKCFDEKLFRSDPDTITIQTMRGSRKFCQKGSNTEVFLADGMKRIEMPLKTGHHRPASETPLRFVGVPIMAHH